MIQEVHINYPESDDSDLDVLGNLDNPIFDLIDNIDEEEEELNESDEESSFL